MIERPCVNCGELVAGARVCGDCIQRSKVKSIMAVPVKAEATQWHYMAHRQVVPKTREIRPR